MTKSTLTVITLTGRTIPAPPRIRTDTERKAKRDLIANRQWLIDQGIEEAKARGDDFNLSWLRLERANNLPQGSIDSINHYLFGDARGVTVST